jgi:AcrR family transcriptional regulator
VNHPVRHRLSAHARRDTIIDAAIRLFSEKGFRGTTTRELSAAIGVTEPVLYEHFRTKHELYDAMMERMASEGLADFTSMLSASTAADPRTFVRALAHAIVAWFVRHPAFIRLLLFSALDGETLSRKFHDRASARVVETVASYANLNPALGGDLDPRVVGHALYCMMVQHGLIHVLFHQEDSRGDGDLVDKMVDAFMSGISR